MNNARDSFVAFMRDGLPNEVVVHYVQHKKDDEGSSGWAMNAVNIMFIDMTFGAQSKVVASIDIMADNESDAVSWTQLVVTMLNQARYTPLMDYTDANDPQPLGANVFWDFPVKFSPVASPGYYYHLSAKVTLNFPQF